MALKRYRIDGRSLSPAEIPILYDLLHVTATITTADLKNHGIFEVFYEETTNILKLSPLLSKCIVTDITQSDM